MHTEELNIYDFLMFFFLGMSLDKEVLKKGLTAVEQIAAVINFASEKELRVRAVGTGSSWSKLTNVRDILMGKF